MTFLMSLIRKIILISWLCFMLLESPKWIKTTEVVPNIPQDTKISTSGVVEVVEAKELEQVAQGDIFQLIFGNKANEARLVAKCESSMRSIKSEMNKNGTFDYGYMGINSIWLKYYNLTEDQVLDPEMNVRTAKKIYDRSGNWFAWRFSKKCHGLD